MTVLRARGVGVAFGGVRAVDGVDLDIGAGEIVGIIGPNGAGKTTLFDALSGLVPSTGRIWLDEVELTRMSPHRRARAGLGRSFQDARLYHALSVLDTLCVASERHVHRRGGVVRTLLHLTRAAEAGASATALELVERFGLGAYRDKLVGELSTGTRRVVDLACLVAQRPAVVLLDEPSSGIAQREAERLDSLVRDLRAEIGCAIVIIEHDMPLLLGLAQRVYALEVGRVIAHGPPDEIVTNRDVVRSYLGDDPEAISRSGAATTAAR